MIIVLKAGTSDADLADVCRRIEAMGLRAHVSRGEQRTIVGAIGDDRFKTRVQALESLECVESLVPILQPFKLASREVHAADTVVEVDGVTIGGRRLTSWRGRAPSSRRRSSRPSPRASRPAAPTSCAVARSSRAPRPTRSRGSRRRG